MANGHGGPRPGSGRKRGSPTRKTTEVGRKAAERRVTPLEVLLEAMLFYHQAGDRIKACSIAKDAAPYVHARLQAVQVSGGEAPVQMQMVEEVVLGIAANGHVSDEGASAGGDAQGETAPGAERLPAQH